MSYINHKLSNRVKFMSYINRKFREEVHEEERCNWQLTGITDTERGIAVSVFFRLLAIFLFYYGIFFLWRYCTFVPPLPSPSHFFY